MLSSGVYFLRFVTIVGVVMACVGNARTNAQTAALVDVIAVVRTIAEGRVFLERNGIDSSTGANEILTQIQNFPPGEAGVMATVLGEFGLRMGTNAPGNTLDARVALRRARERLAREIFFINKGRPNKEPLEVARLAAKYAAYDHSGTTRAAAVIPPGIPTDYKGVVRLDLAKIKRCDGQNQIAELAMFETENPAPSAAVVYGYRATVNAFISEHYLKFIPCQSIQDTMLPVTIGDKHAAVPLGTILLGVPPEEFLKLARAALAASPPLQPPPPPPPSPPAPARISSKSTEALPAEGEARQCKLDDVCVSSDGTAKMKMKCGSFGVEVSTEGAKISLNQGPLEIAFKLPSP